MIMKNSEKERQEKIEVADLLEEPVSPALTRKLAEIAYKKGLVKTTLVEDAEVREKLEEWLES